MGINTFALRSPWSDDMLDKLVLFKHTDTFKVMEKLWLWQLNYGQGMANACLQHISTQLYEHNYCDFV